MVKHYLFVSFSGLIGGSMFVRIGDVVFLNKVVGCG